MGVGDLDLDCELELLTTHESDLNNHEATLAAEREAREGTRSGVLACELAATNRDERLNSREGELADKEKRPVEREQQLTER
jgi:hypothetical protein